MKSLLKDNNKKIESMLVFFDSPKGVRQDFLTKIGGNHEISSGT